MPSVLEGLVTPDIYDKAWTYHLDRNTFGIIEDLYSHILYTVSRDEASVMMNALCLYSNLTKPVRSCRSIFTRFLL